MRCLRIAAIAVACALMLGPAASRASAQVVVRIDKSSQSMSVSVNGQTRYRWEVSTGRSGYGTPSGEFRPQWMARSYFSKKYYNSPMPHSIFFYHGFAIHGTEDIGRLGGPASHGCVRLHPRNAATLFALVERYGMGDTRIVIDESLALKRPPHLSRLRDREDPAIVTRTDRLMREQHGERREAVRQMGLLRAKSAVKHLGARVAGHHLVRRANALELAIGVRAMRPNAVPANVTVFSLDRTPAAKRRLNRERVYPGVPRARGGMGH